MQNLFQSHLVMNFKSMLYIYVLFANVFKAPFLLDMFTYVYAYSC